MRQIILDTETTGISHEQGHRVIEIGCVEIIDRKLTGNHFHAYLNPEREIDEGAFRVHGISAEFLADKPLFEHKASDFINFIKDTEVIIHNAPFDTGFLNSELNKIKWGTRLEDHCTVFDTLMYAREKFPGQRNSLDALCKRFSIDHFNRELHGALLDAEILALVYLAMTGGQSELFAENTENLATQLSSTDNFASLMLNQSLVINPEEEELKAHLEFVATLSKKTEVNYWE